MYAKFNRVYMRYKETHYLVLFLEPEWALSQ